ncbi:hypothetical protein SAY86_004242 [Trapa natans]|uniref:Uncharacterized protein n=1 Tax=Trapa natans TaxID=22666 RepID=A0AAN7RIP2_TRANT|nr:hypothetical protein SAY86_004242 [Trapa natans]
MVQPHESTRGGGGPVKVGTKGTISALMTRELESLKSAPKAPISPRNKHQTVAVSVPCKASSAKRSQLRKSLDVASSNHVTNGHSAEGSRKNKDYKNNCLVPILAARDLTLLDGIPLKGKPERRGRNIVEVVDIRCGNNPDRVRASPVTKLKKLGFSKLSQSII